MPENTLNDDSTSVLEKQLKEKLLPGMFIPDPILLLFSWIEKHQLFHDSPDGILLGYLYPQNKLKEGWTESERPGGTQIDFHAEGNVNLEYWFGHKNLEVMNRLCVFARTGSDGSMAALWIAPDGSQKIVHMGSGSGSVLVCVLADDPVDFLRLIAIGYDEICWNEEYNFPPNSKELGSNFTIHPNIKYQNWVKETFSVTIPEIASEIVRFPSEMGDNDSQDPFYQWVAQNKE